MKPANSNHFSIRELYANEIELHHQEEIHLLGFLKDGRQFIEAEYIISSRGLKMLLENSKTGNELLWKIDRLLKQPHSIPASLNLIELFGITQAFEAREIKLDVPLFKREKGKPQPFKNRELLFVEDVIPLTGTTKNFF